MFERILASIEGGDTFNRALAVATQMARDSGGRARLRLVHALDAALALRGALAFTHDLGDMQSTFDLSRNRGIQLLDDAQQVIHAAGLRDDTELLERYGDGLGNMVANAALRWDADLIVVGIHGRHGVGRVLLGSGAEDIERNAPVPVLVVRMPAATPK